MQTLHFIFGIKNHVLVWQECARGILVFAYGLLLVRLAGRRIFARWSALDLVVSVVVGSSLSRALTGNASLGGTFAAVALIMALHWVLARAAVRYNFLSRILEGRTVVLGEAGRLLENALARHAVSQVDLDEALHGEGLESPEGTRRINLEPSGRISILKAE